MTEKGKGRVGRENELVKSRVVRKNQNKEKHRILLSGAVEGKKNHFWQKNATMVEFRASFREVCGENHC